MLQINRSEREEPRRRKPRRERGDPEAHQADLTVGKSPGEEKPRREGPAGGTPESLAEMGRSMSRG